MLHRKKAMLFCFKLQELPVFFCGFLLFLNKFLWILQVLFPHECKKSRQLKEVTAVEDSMTTMKGSCFLTLLLAGLGVLEILEPTTTDDTHCHRTEHPIIAYKGKM